MGEQVGGIPEAPALTEPSQGSIGVYLARQRQLRGISLDDLADLTKIPRRSLERLEAGAFDGNADGFSRGFVRTVADALGLESEDAVMRLLCEPAETDEGVPNGRTRLLRGVLIGCGASLAVSIVFAAIWWLRGPSQVPQASDSQTPGIVYRRDAVRALAESQARRASDTVPALETESVDSSSGDAPHGSPDSPLGRNW